VDSEKERTTKNVTAEMILLRNVAGYTTLRDQIRNTDYK
jgi:hypothetical protein